MSAEKKERRELNENHKWNLVESVAVVVIRELDVDRRKKSEKQCAA